MNRIRRPGIGIICLIMLSMIGAGLPSIQPARAATSQAEIAATAQSITIVSTIQAYSAPEVYGTATYNYTGLNLSSSGTLSYAAATRLQFSSDGTCSKVSDTRLRCEPDVTTLEVVTDYRFEVTATGTGFVHPITSRNGITADRDVTLIYPPSFTYLSASLDPTGQGNNSLSWTASDINDFAVEVTFDIAPQCDAIDAMLVLDGSGSIRAREFVQLQDFARDFVAGFDLGADRARVGVVQFEGQSLGRTEIGLSSDADAILTAIDEMTQISAARWTGTDIQEGIQLAREELAASPRADVLQVIIVLTDGDDNQPGDPVAEANLARAAGMSLLGVAIGGNLDIRKLNRIVGDPDRVFGVSDFDDLQLIVKNTVTEACTPPPPPPPPPPAPEPALSAIEPAEGYNDAATAVQISGTGLPTDTVDLLHLSNPHATVDLTDIVPAADGESLAASVPAGLPAGIYSLTSRAADGSSLTLANAFTVLARAPEIERVLPAAGYNDQDVEITVFGLNFADGATVSLDSTTIETKRINGTTLQAIVPALLPVGVYDLTVTNPDDQQATLADAYNVLDASSNNDLLGYDHELWVNPLSPRAGATTEIGALVHRLGGKAVLQDVTVEFRRDAVDGPVLGRSTVPFLDPPNSIDSTMPLEVTFSQAETFDLYAIIDPDNLVPEDTETNNVISRTVTVLPPSADLTVPVIQRIAVDGGNTSLTIPRAGLDVEATDPQPNASGVESIHVIEYVYNVGAGQWVPVVQSGWLPFSQNPASLNWSLLPLPGVHYLQVRAVDAAGNISIGRSQQLANYEPSAKEIGRRQTHIYRYTAEAGQQLTANLDVLSGDADLYVWSSRADQSARVSNLEGSVDEQVTIPASEIVPGVYQVEVYGFTAARYRLNVDVGTPTVQMQAAPAGGLSQSKVAPSAPIVPIDSVPDERAGTPPAPAQNENRVYLPFVAVPR
jgi:hypothetical protein